jgi:hypothetical protein
MGGAAPLNGRRELHSESRNPLSRPRVVMASLNCKCKSLVSSACRTLPKPCQTVASVSPGARCACTLLETCMGLEVGLCPTAREYKRSSAPLKGKKTSKH